MNLEPQIILTNDDGIRSPGLWAAAEALDELGFVTVVAPREQSSGTGRSFPDTADGLVEQQELEVNGRKWTVHAVGGTPAMAALYGTHLLAPHKPDLLVSGINYGINVGLGVTISGTVGAALEAGCNGIPSLAISLETDAIYHDSYSTEIDFDIASHFTKYFSSIMLKKQLPPDVSVLKVEVPAEASVDTEWITTRLATKRFYRPLPPDPETIHSRLGRGYEFADDWDQNPPGTDTHTVVNRKMVAVTPLSLDLTSRVELAELDQLLRKA